ncbi:hypothetical protein EAG_04530 [Camponotus floridanus]|uniref:Uncharacterized protein n=1 Tax=Camponotus floridanus TaxID=104421 RepID=E2AQR5_CAMFO|nr:hypothetical protein EAG_04530 [Camponotus floridanus]
MSLILTLTGRSSVLAVSYFSAIDLIDADYELELTDFETYHTIPNMNRDVENDYDEEYQIALRANHSTLKSEIKCAYRINFTKPDNVGSLLGFSSNRILQPRKWCFCESPGKIGVRVLRGNINGIPGVEEKFLGSVVPTRNTRPRQLFSLPQDIMHNARRSDAGPFYRNLSAEPECARVRFAVGKSGLMDCRIIIESSR